MVIEKGFGFIVTKENNRDIKFVVYNSNNIFATYIKTVYECKTIISSKNVDPGR